MQQDEVIQEALRNAPPSPAAIDPPAADGEKVINPASFGDVDLQAVTAWVEANGGRVAWTDAVPLQETTGDRQRSSAPGTYFWVIPEAALDL